MPFFAIIFLCRRHYPQWGNLGLALFLDLSRLLSADFLSILWPQNTLEELLLIPKAVLVLFSDLLDPESFSFKLSSSSLDS